jgi:hypothetical protein
MQGAAITNAYIGSFIQSYTYNPGAGWRIDKSGAAVFSALTVYNTSGQIMLTSGGGLEGTQIKDLTVGTLKVVNGINVTNVNFPTGSWNWGGTLYARLVVAGVEVFNWGGVSAFWVAGSNATYTIKGGTWGMAASSVGNGTAYIQLATSGSCGSCPAEMTAQTVAEEVRCSLSGFRK